MLVRIARSISAARAQVSAARSMQTEIELSPVYGGETRSINVTRVVLDENGKPARDENGKLVQTTVKTEIPYTVAARYAKATRARRNAARRVAAAERRFALVAAELPVEKVVKQLRKIYG